MKRRHWVVLLIACGFVAAGAIAMGQLLDLSQSMLLALLANGLWLAAATGALVSLVAIVISQWRARARSRFAGGPRVVGGSLVTQRRPDWPSRGEAKEPSR